MQTPRSPPIASTGGADRRENGESADLASLRGQPLIARKQIVSAFQRGDRTGPLAASDWQNLHTPGSRLALLSPDPAISGVGALALCAT
jgi:hypothetical protein